MELFARRGASRLLSYSRSLCHYFVRPYRFQSVNTEAKMTIKKYEDKYDFSDIYLATSPVRYKKEIFDGMEYTSDKYSKKMFDRLILPWIQKREQGIKGIPHVVDLCSSFGNTTMATVYGMDYQEIQENWRDEEACMTINAKRQFGCRVTGIDISKPAVEYGQKVGLFDDIIASDLNDTSLKSDQERVQGIVKDADVLMSAAGLVYLDTDPIERLVEAFAAGSKDGYLLVNFLIPFNLDEMDAAKRKLLKHLDFVGSMAGKHRRMSEEEMKHYPGEEWVLLEIWILKRKPGDRN